MGVGSAEGVVGYVPVVGAGALHGRRVRSRRPRFRVTSEVFGSTRSTKLYPNVTRRSHRATVQCCRSVLGWDSKTRTQFQLLSRLCQGKSTQTLLGSLLIVDPVRTTDRWFEGRLESLGGGGGLGEKSGPLLEKSRALPSVNGLTRFSGHLFTSLLR